ncbi:MAG: hypothetical protein KGN35_00735 [Betaproteobacteria bacterium]|nr:hypothetical protein [Betaproteobacteria bacterium]
MAQDRKTLKAKFKNGKMPTEAAFADLIDSTLNLIDDGFEKTVKDGLKVFQLGDGKLMSFYQNMSTLSAMWFAGIDKATGNLSFGDQQNPHVLTLRSANSTGPGSTAKAGVGINTANPRYELDVAGTIASFGRMGRRGELPVPADGDWHDITEMLTGCQAFEVVAGVGGKDADGKYALMHAFALNAYNDKSHITYHQAYYGAKCNRLELRWEKSANVENFEYTLQLRVGSSFGGKIWVNYYLTRLWQDPAMYESETEPESGYPKVFRKRQEVK